MVRSERRKDGKETQDQVRQHRGAPDNRQVGIVAIAKPTAGTSREEEIVIRFKILFTHLVVFTVAVLSQASTNLPPNDQQMAYGQSISCTFTAMIVRITRLETTLPPTNKLKGYLIDKDPKWELELDVLDHKRKIPFQPGLRKCYIADVQSVFNTQADKVQGQYIFSFIWNIGVPGRSEFESFRARKKSIAEPTNPSYSQPATQVEKR